MRTNNAGASPNFGQPQASCPPWYSQPAHKERRYRRSKAQACANEAAVIYSKALGPFAQLPRLDVLVVLRESDPYEPRVVVPVCSCTKHACPQAQLCCRPYEERRSREDIACKRSALVSCSKRRVRCGGGSRAEDRVLQRCIRTKRIWSLGNDFVLPFAYTDCQPGCCWLTMQDLPGGTNKRNTMFSVR